LRLPRFLRQKYPQQKVLKRHPPKQKTLPRQLRIIPAIRICKYSSCIGCSGRERDPSFDCFGLSGLLAVVGLGVAGALYAQTIGKNVVRAETKARMDEEFSIVES
jgi:hypothetical protein